MRRMRKPLATSCWNTVSESEGRPSIPMIVILTLPRFPLLDFFPFKIAIDAVSEMSILLGFWINLS